MTRTERLLRLARLRGDRAAEIILEGRTYRYAEYLTLYRRRVAQPTETELRALWGDR